MLLQRASAGSGKTFTLAKTYTRLFISKRGEDGRYVLRSPGEIRDEHAHILGVTFTNKATNEMKSRIVSKLAALAAEHPEAGEEPENHKTPDYLKNFTGEDPGSTDADDIIYNAAGRPASRRQIAETCRAALKALLNDYGHFNISTIDTFFQGILRSLAYELRLNDNYHVEINDDYLAQVGVDETLLDMKNSSGRRKDENFYACEWARRIAMERLEYGEDWNMFNKSGADSPFNSKSLYSEMLKLARNMSKESFKLALEATGDYFKDPGRFRNFYEATRSASCEASDKRTKCKARLKEFEEGMERLHGKAWREQLSAGMQTSLEKIRRAGAKINIETDGISKKLYGCSRYFQGESGRSDKPFKKNTPASCDSDAAALLSALADSLAEWAESSAYWDTVMSRLHYMGVMHDIRRNIEKFRTDNNVIPLSETNEILRGIIGEDDNAFIYERIGTQLHHYLLDEFQDTSVMQWENLRPLLLESEAYGYDNLIIGDSKQSIYRFRNAEPELINSHVENEIPDTRVLPDSLPKGSSQYARVNTNWRSSRHTVEFNNTVFSAMAASLQAQTPDLAKLYENVIQDLGNPDMPGFVRISFPTSGRGAYNCFAGLGAQIDELRSRGYRLGDIAVLVKKVNDGREAISALMRYNDEHSHEEGWQPIEIISEDSLKVGESVAVKVILAVMGMISRSYRLPATETTDEETRGRSAHRKMRRYEMSQMVANFHYSRASQTSSDPFAALSGDMAAFVNEQELDKMLRELEAFTLPSLVEAIAAHLLHENISRSQAPYIAAFEDAVLEYCESYAADINSFLNWWDENGYKLTISAPEGTDALRVMTIHKSKGLEFNVVIIPKADWNIGPQKEEEDILWVSHSPHNLPPEALEDVPPLIPVTPNGRNMSDPASPFHQAYREYFNKCVCDEFNATYVAFTRAVRELHVFAPLAKSATEGNKVGICLRNAIACANSGQPGWTTMPDGGLEYGNPTYRPARPETDSGRDVTVIDRYCTGDGSAQIICRAEDN